MAMGTKPRPQGPGEHFLVPSWHMTTDMKALLLVADWHHHWRTCLHAAVCVTTQSSSIMKSYPRHHTHAKPQSGMHATMRNGEASQIANRHDSSPSCRVMLLPLFAFSPEPYAFAENGRTFDRAQATTYMFETMPLKHDGKKGNFKKCIVDKNRNQFAHFDKCCLKTSRLNKMS